MLPILQPYNLGWWANQSASQRPIKSFYSDRFEFFQESVRTYVRTVLPIWLLEQDLFLLTEQGFVFNPEGISTIYSANSLDQLQNELIFLFSFSALVIQMNRNSLFRKTETGLIFKAVVVLSPSPELVRVNLNKARWIDACAYACMHACI